MHALSSRGPAQICGSWKVRLGSRMPGSRAPAAPQIWGPEDTPAVPQPKARSGVPGLRLCAALWSAEGPDHPQVGGRPGPGAGPEPLSSPVQTQALGGHHAKNW